MRKNLREFMLIVTGVLVALFIDTLREEHQERRILDDYLRDVAAEIAQNEYTLGAMRDGLLPDKLAALDRVLAALAAPTVLVADSAALLRDLATSSWSVRPWLISDRYEALRSSGQLRLLRDSGIASALAGFNEAPTVLFPLAEELRGDYAVLVHSLLPPALASELSPVRLYLEDMPIPPPTVAVAYEDVWQELRRQREILRAGARGEIAYATAYGYALARYQEEFGFVLEILEPWRPDPGSEGAMSPGR